jgi:enterochelin esterase-like enzyme
MIGTALLSLIAAASLMRPAVTPVSPPGLPADWQAVAGGPDGGTVWVGRIPNTEVRWDRRASAIYLPPGYAPDRRYPVIYLLHGLRGSPSGFYDGMRLAKIADGLIASNRVQPFIAVMPVGGPIVDPDRGEWAGVWEKYVVRDVVPWTDAHLSTVPGPQGRALEGLCAGGFGALDIGLRHPGLFGTLGSWEGYFSARFRDGPFVDANAADLAAHDPTLLVRRQASSLRRSGVRFYVSVGGNHAQILRKWTIDFAAELEGLGLQHELWQLPAPRRKDFWRATLPSALTYAAQGFASV